MKTYEQALNWMFKKLPMYQREGSSAYRKDLDNIILLSNHLKNPEKRIKTIHIAGTNGKGSTSSMISSVLQEAGYRVGLYTSPHLSDFRERIKIGKTKINKEFVFDFISKNKDFFEENNLSFFEMTTGMAFQYFEEKKVDIAIIEVGMGGRLDSTNIITPLVSVITNVGLDHTQFLGNTISEIATEKAGIFKPDVPVVIGEHNQNFLKKLFKEKAKKAGTKVYFAADLIGTTPKSDLIGKYQVRNKKGVLLTLEILKDNYKFKISDENIQKGLLKVVENTDFFGRYQILGENPKIICDIAHNPQGLSVVLNQIKKEKYRTLHIIFGTVSDKDLSSILPLFPTRAIYHFCKPNVPRGLDVDTLQQMAEKYSLHGHKHSSVKEAFRMARKNATEQDLIFIGGSSFVVGEVVHQTWE